MSHSIIIPDLLPGEGLQVKPSISTASLALSPGALSIPCLPSGTDGPVCEHRAHTSLPPRTKPPACSRYSPGLSKWSVDYVCLHMGCAVPHRTQPLKHSLQMKLVQDLDDHTCSERGSCLYVLQTSGPQGLPCPQV